MIKFELRRNSRLLTGNIKEKDMEELLKLHNELCDFIRKNWKSSLKEPIGNLKHRFLDPAATYDGQMWDWDSFFCATALYDVYEDIGKYIEGCVLNFFDYQREDGSMPYVIYADDGKSHALPLINIKARTEDCNFNSVKPLLAQMVMLAYGKNKDIGFLKSVFGKLKKHISHWESTQQKKNGLFVWRSLRGSGSDNHPAIYGRPLNSSAGVELNCFMYLEMSAMAEIAGLCADEAAREEYLLKKEKLVGLINDNMWDPIDGLYYHLDMLSERLPTATQEISWNVPLKFRMWTCFFPMYAGIAPVEYAERMVREHLTNPLEFWSDFGLRTMAKNEPIYNTRETSNPSNWQGPIWIVSTYIVFCGLLNYGYISEAKELARNLLSNMCRDIRENGLLHEYYNPETGLSNMTPGFMNWNALAGLMVPKLIEAEKKQDNKA